MSEAAIWVAGEVQSSLLLVADHASNRVPDDIDLGIEPALLDEHIALDIGTRPLTLALAALLGAPAILGSVSRLVVDLHRREDEPSAFPAVSDGNGIKGNEALSATEKEARLERFWRPYHQLIDARVEQLRPRLIVGVHSCTPRLESRPLEERPWEVGILYNRDDHAARLAIGRLREAGIETGDNQPYSGIELNATMDRHAEARAIPYIVFELRNDLIRDEAGVAFWASRLAPIIVAVRDALSEPATSIRTGT